MTFIDWGYRSPYPVRQPLNFDRPDWFKNHPGGPSLKSLHSKAYSMRTYGLEKSGQGKAFFIKVYYKACLETLINRMFAEH